MSTNEPRQDKPNDGQRLKQLEERLDDLEDRVGHNVNTIIDKLEETQEELEELREENERLKERVGMSESPNNGLPEDVPKIMKYEKMPKKDRDIQLSENRQRAVDAWSLWDVYADCGGEYETLSFDQLQRYLRSRRNGDNVRYQTVKRVADFMVRLGEGMLEVKEVGDSKKIVRKLSVDEWRKDHYERKLNERRKRELESKQKAEEEVERVFGDGNTK